ncbi:MAG TPA: glutaredoxin domain-containing protein [Solirubrobacteraceae bacterium]|jgi:glutaredoxin 3
MSKVTVYTTDPCSFCVRLKGLLGTRGLAYEEINLSRDPVGRAELVSKTGMMTFPQVLVGDRVVGGYAETLSAMESGALQELLTAA